MASPENSISDEPLTPAGRLFLHPQLNTIIHCVLGTDDPKHLDLDELKSAVKNSILTKHPRFCSLMVTDGNGVEHWRRLPHMDIDRHVIVVQNTYLTVNDYLADLSVSCPLSFDKPLWELHLLKDHNCVVFRIHHALGDGISLMSMLLDNCRRADDPLALPRLSTAGGGGRWVNDATVWGLVKMVWFSLVYMVDFVVRVLWVCDEKTVIAGDAGVELWPRKLATARFWLEDMKIVKKAVAGATINDVLFGILSIGISRYLDHRKPNGLKEGLRLTGVAMVNLREQQGLQDLNELMKSNPGTGWGNKFGMILLPLYFHKAGNDPLKYVRRAKAMIDCKKQSLEAYLTYVIGDFIMSWFGAKGLTMHMVSYEGKADMQILVAKDIIPDPDFLAKCFEDGLLQMKEAALLAAKIS